MTYIIDVKDIHSLLPLW